MSSSTATTPHRGPILVTSPPIDPADALDRRDERVLRAARWAADGMATHFYRARVEGLEHLEPRACLVVSTHNGSLFVPDLVCTFAAWWRRYGLETPVYGLAHDILFQVPGLRDLVLGFGAIPASAGSAEAVLGAGHPLLVCPGGDLDALKPTRDRHRVVFGPRRGFVRLALRLGVPVVPVVSTGAHEVFWVPFDGRKVARATGLERLLRVKSVPFTVGIPFGPAIAGVGNLPLPTPVHVRVLPEIRFEAPPEAAEDDAVVEQCFEKVRGAMQEALDELARERRGYGPLAGRPAERLGSLRRRLSSRIRPRRR